MITVYLNSGEFQRQSETRIADDRVRAATMQTYLNQIAKLLLENGLGTPGVSPEVKSIARAYTITALLEIDEKRKGQLLRFLFEGGLIDAGERMPDDMSKSWKEKASGSLKRANFGRADLRGAFLAKPSGIDLICVSLEEADLRDAVLSEAHLYEANLRDADLRGACLNGTDLRTAILCGADLRGKSLKSADLRGTDLRGCRWDDKTNFAVTQRDNNTKGIERVEFSPDPLDEGSE